MKSQSPKNLILYSTLGCHLCEHAKLMVESVAQRYGLALKEIEISDSDTLMQQYGLIIPVLEVESEPKRALNWPFTAADVQALLAEI